MRSQMVLLAAALSFGAARAQTADVTEDGEPKIEKMAVRFAAPERLKAGGKYVRTEEPGWAAPCWHDVNRDGRKDLAVGQFADGKILICLAAKDRSLAAGEWLEADGEIAEVPGVW
jgi:hypothetical protein